MAMLIRREMSPWVRPVMEDFYRWANVWDEDLSLPGLAADLFQTADSVIVEMSVPGINPEDIQINVTGDTLSVTGESQQETEEEKRNYLQRQIVRGKFVQSVTLPALVASERAEANFQHGILRITLPKAEEAKPKEIRINTAS